MRGGGVPRIEDYLQRMTTDVERSVLLKELVLLEMECRRQTGEKFDVFEYARRFPYPAFPSQELGSILGAIETRPPAAGALAVAAAPTAGGLRVILSVVAGPSRGQRFSFDRQDTFVAGRGSLAHLKLPSTDQFSSRVHFQLEVSPPCCRLTNMSSTNGTFVNGVLVSNADLKDGDIILAGDTAIRVSIE